MPRRSKRKQNRKKNHKQNSSKKIKYNLEKQNLANNNVNLRLNGTAPQTSKVESSYQNKSLQFEFESDSDPDVFFEFHPDIEVSRAKSDSALSKLRHYIGESKLFCGSGSTSRECSDAEKAEVQASIDSCRNTLTESVSTTRTVDSSDIKLINKLKSNSGMRLRMSGYRSSRDILLSSRFVPELQKNINLEDMKIIPNVHGSVPLLISSGEKVNAKKEKSFENLNQQIIMKLSDEALELGITAIPPKRLSSSSNILINNHTIPGSCTKKSFTELEMIPNKTVYTCNNHLSRTTCKTPEQESARNEDKMYLESTKNEKQLLNCSFLGDEPQSRSTPILKTSRSKEKWKSLTDANVTLLSENAVEEYYTCPKEFFREESTKNDKQESATCLSQYVSCWDVSNPSKEILKLFPPEYKNSEGRLVLKTSLRDVSIQCELLKTDSEIAVQNQEEVEKEIEEEIATEGNLNVSMIARTGQIGQSQANFETFKKLFTRISIQKFLHILSILPMDKILEFFCLTFSIPLIETMAISISVTKVMNILSSTTFIPNFNEKLKNYKLKAVDYLRKSWTNLVEIFVKYRSDEIDGLPKESRACLCDTQKVTDLEKRLKNLENELTKFQYVDAEIEKLKEIAKSFQQVAFRTVPGLEAGIAAPPSPQPPPPPPPPPPPLPPAPTPSSGSFLTKPKKTHIPQDSVSRPSITVEDLQKVILKKVTAKLAHEPKKGPVVSLEMLKSVKLRSSARKKTPTCSPTRTPTSRERIRRINSPFRSSSRSTDRKSRYPNIPLSEILGSDGSYQLFDQKMADTQKKDSSTLY